MLLTPQPWAGEPEDGAPRASRGSVSALSPAGSCCSAAAMPGQPGTGTQCPQQFQLSERSWKWTLERSLLIVKLIENNVACVQRTHLLALSALRPVCETLPNPAHLCTLTLVCVWGGEGDTEHHLPAGKKWKFGIAKSGSLELQKVEVWNCSNSKI